MIRSFSLILFSLLMFSSANSQVRVDGEIKATSACPAFASIRKATNPGDVLLEVGQSYTLRGYNSAKKTHYWIEVPGAQPPMRWVEVACGSIGKKSVADAASPSPVLPEKSQGVTKRVGQSSDFYVLALSWQPAFCESGAGASKRECKNQRAGDAAAQEWSLHGLWPQPRSNVFCNVSEANKAASEDRRWSELPDPELTPDTRARVAKVMPGAKSLLDRHEWIKHGTCFPGTAEEYYQQSARLVEAVNASPASRLMALNVGRTLKTQELREAFDKAFGQGAGARVRIACKRDGDRQLITEITVGLRGQFGGDISVADMILASSPTDPGCPEGIVDPVGRQ
jgi:ribonuclease T2